MVYSAVCIAEEKFLVLPHEEVAEYIMRKGNDRDRWISGMQRLQKQYEDFLTPADMTFPRGDKE